MATHKVCVIILLVSLACCFAAGPFLPFRPGFPSSGPAQCETNLLATFEAGGDNIGILPTVAELNNSTYGTNGGWAIGVSTGLVFSATNYALKSGTNWCGNGGFTAGAGTNVLRAFLSTNLLFNAAPVAIYFSNSPVRVTAGCWLVNGFPNNHKGTHDVFTLYAQSGCFCNFDFLGNGSQTAMTAVLETQEQDNAFTPTLALTNGQRVWLTARYSSINSDSTNMEIRIYDTDGSTLISSAFQTNALITANTPCQRLSLGVQNSASTTNVAEQFVSHVDYDSLKIDTTANPVWPLLP